jgi:hypothetical protein
VANKELKIHLASGGLPLCERESRILDLNKVKFELTLKFEEVTCKKCKMAINKISRSMGYANA